MKKYVASLAFSLVALLMLSVSSANAEEPGIKQFKQRVVGKWELDLIYDESHLLRVFKTKSLATFLKKTNEALGEVGTGFDGGKWRLELSEDGKFKLAGQIKSESDSKLKPVSASGEWNVFPFALPKKKNSALLYIRGTGYFGDHPWGCGLLEFPVAFDDDNTFSGPCFWGEADDYRWVFTRVK